MWGNARRSTSRPTASARGPAATVSPQAIAWPVRGAPISTAISTPAASATLSPKAATSHRSRPAAALARRVSSERSDSAKAGASSTAIHIPAHCLAPPLVAPRASASISVGPATASVSQAATFSRGGAINILRSLPGRFNPR